MGHEPLTKWVVLCAVSIQIAVAVLLRHVHPLSPWFLLCAYAIGGTLNHNLFLAIHEITHNLAFKGITANKALAIFANLPIGIPYCATFKVCTNISFVSTNPYIRPRNTTWNITSRWEKMAWIPTYLPALSL